jgi:hypothetical protein
MLAEVLAKARTPVDSASVAVFRMFFGAIAAWEVGRYFHHGWITSFWEEPTFHFHYVGFGWVEPLPAPGMRVLWLVLGVAAIGIAAGALYRIATVVFAVGFGYSFLLETALYLNHFYFIELLAILLVFVPAHRVWSVDAWSRDWPNDGPSPAWALWLLRFQVGVLYVGGGVAKLESDWLHGQPMSMWLSHRTDFPLIGRFFDHAYAGITAAWLGLFFDLFIVFAVAWRRTRLIALVAALAFHFTNDQLFSIGVFPFLALACLLLFCDPDWPRALIRRLRGRRWTPQTFEAPPSLAGRSRQLATAGFALAVVYAVAQVAIPLRHLTMPGRSAWTEAGHTFSWHMKLRDKSGDADFAVETPGEPTHYISVWADLTDWQYSAMAGRPELIRQYAHHVADLEAARDPEGRRPKVRAFALVSLNGRQPQPMIDSKVDLAAEPATLGTPSWVAQELELLAPDLLARLEAALGAPSVTKFRFVVGSGPNRS